MEQQGKYKRVIICGASGSGKSTLLREFRRKGWICGWTITTRPRREDEYDETKIYSYDDETEGIIMITESTEYIFTDEENYEYLKGEQPNILETKFNNWIYSITEDALRISEVIIMSPKMIELLKEEEIEKSIVVYLNIKEEVREKRLQQRISRHDHIERRLKADAEQFKNFKNYTVEYKEENLNTEDVVKRFEKSIRRYR